MAKAKKKTVKKASKKKRVNGREKGNRAERALAKAFSKWWGSEFTRTPMSGGFATKKFRGDWNAEGDLVTPDGTFPFTVESKHAEGWNFEQLLTSHKTMLHAWWAQTLRETPDGKIPLLVFRKNRLQPMICLRRDDAFPLYDVQHGRCVYTHPKFGFLETFLITDEVLIVPLSALFEITSKEDWIEHVKVKRAAKM